MAFERHDESFVGSGRCRASLSKADLKRRRKPLVGDHRVFSIATVDYRKFGILQDSIICCDIVNQINA